ncbi:MAG: hypothetical protein RRY07_09320, partial [Bacteroidaceae bacterium]
SLMDTAPPCVIVLCSGLLHLRLAMTGREGECFLFGFMLFVWIDSVFVFRHCEGFARSNLVVSPFLSF